MKSLEADINAYIALAIATARDDVTVSQAAAIGAQHLSPAEPVNPKYAQQLKALSRKIDMSDYPEVERRFAEELAKVTHFESGAPFLLLPRFVLHVGPGLDAYTQEGAFTGDFVDTLMALRGMTKDLAHLTSTAEVYYVKGSVTMVAPEAMRNECAAALDVLKAYALVRNKPTGVLTVVCMTEGMVSALVNAVVDVGLQAEMAVCLHHKDGAKTVHRLDEEGFLEDWPYGVLNSHVDSGDLHEMGFTPARRY